MNFVNRHCDFSLCRYKRDILYFILYFVLFIVVYGAMFMRLGLHWDEMYDRYGDMNGTYVAAGRWGLALFRTIMGKGSMPWTYGLVAAGSISAALVLQTRMFRLDDGFLRIMYGGLYVSCTQFLFQLRYSYQGDAIAFGILCATIGMYILSTYDFNRVRSVWVILLFTVAIAMYQSIGVYIVALGLACFLAISYFVKKILAFFLCLSLSMFVWWGISKMAINFGFAGDMDICAVSCVRNDLIGWKEMLKQAGEGNYYIMKWYFLVTPRILLGTTYPGAWLYATVFVPMSILVWKILFLKSNCYPRLFVLFALWISPCATSLVMGWACPQTRAELANPLALAFLWILCLRDFKFSAKGAIISLLLTLFVLVRASYTVSSFAWNERLETIRAQLIERTIEKDVFPLHQ